MGGNSRDSDDVRLEDQQLLLEIGRKIKMLRKKKKLSYIALAEAIGISRNTYNQVELGQTKFKIGTLLSILAFHDISLKQFLKEVISGKASK